MVGEKEQQISKMGREMKQMKEQMDQKEEEVQEERDRMQKEQDRLEGLYQQKQEELVQNMQKEISIVTANLHFELRQAKFKSDDYKNKYLHLKEQGMGDHQQTILLLQNQSQDYQHQLILNLDVIQQVQTQNALLKDQIHNLLTQHQHQLIPSDLSLLQQL